MTIKQQNKASACGERDTLLAPTHAKDSTRPQRQRRMAREGIGRRTVSDTPGARAPSKLDRMQELICRPEGASLADLIAATNWQAHSVRGAIAGALKRRGLAIVSEVVDEVRRYRADRPA